MALPRFASGLVFRLAAVGIVLLAVALGSRLLLLSGVLREGIGGLVGDHLLAVATYVAADVDGKVRLRQRLLEDVAKDMPREFLRRPAKLEEWLADRHSLLPLFSLGMLVVAADGNGAVADYPRVDGRRRIDFTSVDWFLAARDQGRFVIGKPRVGRASHQSVVVMAAPVRDERGRVVAVVGGVTALDAPGFLDLIQDNRIGRSGGYLLVSPRDKIFVAASDPARRLGPLPAAGADRLHDLAMSGYRGAGTTVDDAGIEELEAVAGVPAADWFVVARMPTAEAFATVGEMRRLVTRNGLAISVGLLLAFIAFLAYTLRPMKNAAREMRRMADGEIPLQRLPVRRDDEIGTMIGSFNQLVDRLNEDEAALVERSRALEQALANLHESEARMAHMAHHDALTGLPNRALFDDRLGQALARAERSGMKVALLFMDLDGFKPINDGHGHEVGDQVLRQVAQRLRENTRRADTVARLGGDEFVVLLADLPEPRQAAVSVAEKCLEVVAPDFLVDDLRLRLGFSIGIALYPDDADGAATLLARSDQAMYRAKQQGRGGYAFFEEEA